MKLSPFYRLQRGGERALVTVAGPSNLASLVWQALVLIAIEAQQLPKEVLEKLAVLRGGSQTLEESNMSPRPCLIHDRSS